jgi:hypothetical protein
MDTSEKTEKTEKKTIDKSKIIDIQANVKEAFDMIFNTKTLPYFAGFIVLYASLYFGIYRFYRGRSDVDILFSKTIDIFIITLLVVGLMYYFFTLPKEDKDHFIGFLVKWTKEFFQDPVGSAASAILIALFYLFVYLGGIPKNPIPKTIEFLEQKVWIFLVTYIILDFFKYYFEIDLMEKFISKDTVDWLYGKSNNSTDEKKDAKKKDKKQSTVTDEKKIDEVGNEVFHVSNNLYSYDDAQAICTSYGARIATYDELENAYKSGAEWCGYGWSDGQMALFPTQKSTWDKLQKTDNYKNNCGRPGINGGYIHNPYVKFGANCYGKKPVANTADINRMNAQKNTLYPKSRKDVVSDMKTEYWKNNSDKLVINGFNNDKWSSYISK